MTDKLLTSLEGWDEKKCPSEKIGGKKRSYKIIGYVESCEDARWCEGSNAALQQEESEFKPANLLEPYCVEFKCSP